MSDAPLIQQLDELRSKARATLLFFGLASALATAALAAIGLIALDWLLWLPPLPRLVLGFAFVVALSATAIHWVVRPLSLPLSRDELSALLERRFATLADRLRSAVCFLQTDRCGAPGMMQRVIDQVSHDVRDLDLSSIVTRRPLMIRAAILAGSIGALIVISASAPGWLSTGLYRYAYPFGAVEWPRSVEILPLTGNVSVGLGESFTARIRLTRGDEPSLRPLLHARSASGDVTTLAMQRREDHEFTCALSSITARLDYWFEAGDADTRKTPRRIDVVRRPTVTAAIARIEPPAYAPDGPTATYDLDAGPARSVPGSRVYVSIRSSKPIATDTPNGLRAALHLDNDTKLTLIPVAGEPQAAHASFELDETRAFRVHIEDGQRFTNRDAVEYRIIATPDEPPTVRIVRPQRSIDATPAATIPVEIETGDDFGITTLWIEAIRHGHETALRIDLSQSLSTSLAAGGVHGTVGYDWPLATLNLSPGDSITWAALAADNYAYRGADPHYARSNTTQLRIISESDLLGQIRDEVGLLQSHLRRAVWEQESLTDQSRTLASTGRPDHNQPSPQQTDEARVSAAAQNRLAKRVRALARRLQQISARMRRNRVEDPRTQQRIEPTADALAAVAAGPMTDAVEHLGLAGQAPRPEAFHDRIAHALEQQQAAATTMRETLSRLGQWGNFQEIVAKARELLDRQQALRSQTTAYGKSTLGQPFEALTTEQELTVKAATRRQSELGTETEQLVDRTRQLAQRESQAGSATAAALQAAADTATDAGVVTRMQHAARAIQANRTAAAGIEQRAAEQGLAHMLAGLMERRRQELDDQARELERAALSLADLASEQQSVLDATQEADSHDATGQELVRLAELQRAIRNRTGQLAEQLSVIERARSLANRVRTATEPMRRAESDLERNQAKRAAENMQLALETIRQATRDATAMAERTDFQALVQKFMAIRTRLEEIREQQGELRDGASALVKRVAEANRLTRADARRAAILARTQGTIHEQTETTRAEIGGAVYQWALSRIAEHMMFAQEALSQRRIDSQLTATQDRILRDLDQLLLAFDQIAALPPPEMSADDGGGGGGQGQKSQRPSVPTAAELLVLKAVQQDLNARTQELAENVDLDRATETQLEQVRVLGLEQRQLHALTQRIARRYQKVQD